VLADWKNWSSCTEKCNGGTKIRERRYHWGIAAAPPVDAESLAQTDANVEDFSLRSRAMALGSQVFLGMVLGVVAGRGYALVQRFTRRRRVAE
jgi:hypothetical protein